MLLLCSALLLTAEVAAQAGGVWSAPFNHKLDNNDPGWQPGEVATPYVAQADWVTSNPGTPAADRNRVNALHACLIPEGPHRGELIVWDGNMWGNGVRPKQPWAVVNPYWTGPTSPGSRFYNAVLTMPTTGSPPVPIAELFCGGQTWTADGRLFVAGGTGGYPVQNVHAWFGSKLVYQWDPLDTTGTPWGTWWQMPDLFAARWYPTVACDSSDDRVGIFGGSDDYNWQYQPPPPAPPNPIANDPLNHYESYRVDFRHSPPRLALVGGIEQKTVNPGSTPRLYAGPPGTSPAAGLTDYPRVNELTTGEWIVSGFNTSSARWIHDLTQDPTYLYDTGQITANYDPIVYYATSILYPNFGGVYNRLVRIGGMRGTVNATLYTSNMVEVSYAASSGDFWSWAPPTPPGGPGSNLYNMLFQRFKGNVVILPSGHLFAIGGYTDTNETVFNLTPELLVNSNQWVPMAQHNGPRGYHSCAILLPDARVFVCGGEGRTLDYQIWSPPYLTAGLTRPQGVALSYTTGGGGPIPDNLLQGVTWGGGPYLATWTNTLPVGVAVEKVVMMRPMAQTHHDDGGQRYVELTSWPADDGSVGSRFFKGPPSRTHAPPGWYMVFLVTNQGVPSEARWVHLR